MTRHYMVKTTNGDFNFDPRYLVFEFVWNIQLRKKQVDIVNDFRENLKNGTSKVKQMIMGAGKTSVVAPLLALIVADGKSLVLSVVPKALVEMSRTRMRESFAAIMVKRIYTLEFDRSTVVKNESNGDPLK
jgi:late competence protein required for DNA uptake (superfamily II DNA/RNA helicase)